MLNHTMYDLIYTKTHDGWQISGPTFRAKDEIKTEGGKWQPDTKTWFLSDITGLKERLRMQKALMGFQMARFKMKQKQVSY